MAKERTKEWRRAAYESLTPMTPIARAADDTDDAESRCSSLTVQGGVIGQKEPKVEPATRTTINASSGPTTETMNMSK